MKALTTYHHQGGKFRAQTVKEFDQQLGPQHKIDYTNCYSSACGIFMASSIGLNPGDIAIVQKTSTLPEIGSLKKRDAPEYDALIKRALEKDGFLLQAPSANRARYFPLICFTRNQNHDYHFIVPHIKNIHDGNVSFHFSHRRCYRKPTEEFDDDSKIISRYIETQRYENIYPVYAPRQYMGWRFDLSKT